LFSITLPLSALISFAINDIPAFGPLFHRGPLFSTTFPHCSCKKELFLLRLACHAAILSGAKNLALDFSAEEQQGEMESRPATPRQFTMNADEKIVFFGPHGLIVSRLGKGAELADVPRNIRSGSIR
jgi:hypothetical protein